MVKQLRTKKEIKKDIETLRKALLQVMLNIPDKHEYKYKKGELIATKMNNHVTKLLHLWLELKDVKFNTKNENNEKIKKCQRCGDFAGNKGLKWRKDPSGSGNKWLCENC